MLYPYIYTRTKYHDFRLVTSKSICAIPEYIKQIFHDVACTMINVDDKQLREPSWALVRKDGYTLWGMAILNEFLSEKNQDKTGRPVRGFFGFISDNQISSLPYSISYFKEIYKTYVMPIWDSPLQSNQVDCLLPTISGDEFITKSTLLSRNINVELETCRIFPYGSDCKGLTEAVFASFEDCSIAINIHKKSRCIEFGKDKLSFMNVVGASDSGIRNEQDIKVYVKEEPVIVKPDPVNDKSSNFEASISSQCGNPTIGDDTFCPECKDKQRNQKYLEYGLYGFFIIISLVFILKGSSIWESIFSPMNNTEIENHGYQSNELKEIDGYKNAPFLTTGKPEFNIEDADLDQFFTIQYKSSSPIQKAQLSDAWIHIITPAHQYSISGNIEFACEPLDQGSRDGAIELINADGEKCIIQIHQTTSNQDKHDTN